MEVQTWQVPPDNTVQVVEAPGNKFDDEDEDGVPRKKNWMSIIISLSIISVVLFMVTIATLLMGPQDPPFFGRRLKMKDLFDENFKTKPMGVQWLDGDKLAYRSEGAGIRLLDPREGTNTSLVTELAMQQTGALEFSVSPDLKYVLLSHDFVKGQLYTRTALYNIYDISTNHYYPLTLSGGLSLNTGMSERLQLAQWAGYSFDLSVTQPKKGESLKQSLARGTALILISNNTVYYKQSPSSNAINLTPDANPDTISYGAPDLLYQEILLEPAAIWPSPFGKSLLVARFNDSQVRELPVLQYGGGYPRTVSLRYPTVETPLPEVTLWLYDLTSSKRPYPRSKLQPPISLREKPYYVISGRWADEDRVWVTWVGGDQSVSALTLCSKPDWLCSNVLINQMKDEASPIVRGVKWTGKWAAFPWSAKDDEGSWHSHVALVGEAGGRRPPLTSPEYHVKEVLGTDLKSNLVFFTGSETASMKGEGKYTEHVYSTSADGRNKVVCVTCHIRNKNVKFVDEHDPIQMKIESRENAFNEWCHSVRDVGVWNSKMKTDNSSSCELNVSLATLSSIHGVNKQSMYKECRTVHAEISPLSNYIAVTCMDDNAVPPSLWLIDLMKFKSISQTDDETSHFGAQKLLSDNSDTHLRDTGFDLPLLLHTQSETRYEMGGLAMPKTEITGIRLGDSNRNNQKFHGDQKKSKDSVYSKVILTVPPGWSPDDHSWLFPLVIQIIGPDEPVDPWSSKDEISFHWSDYLASGHQVAHAQMSLWGADPSVHTSARQLADFHVEAVRQLLEKYPFLDENNVAIYGRGSGGTIAMEAVSTSDIFQCVVLISPINDWHAHGVYWSERILGTATEEGAEQRYVESNIARLAVDFKNSTPILLVHGTSDQYSHHGFSLARSLTKHGAHFSHVVYPTDAEHAGLRRVTRHLLAEVEYFLFSWIHDPLIYEDEDGNMVDDTSEINMRKYEQRFDIIRSYGKLKPYHHEI